MDPDLGPDPGPDLTVVLLGNCGVGKSASGNTVLGRAAFESKTSFKAGESEIREEAGRVFGKVIRVIDTPGILGREEPVGRRCRDVLESPGSHLFLLVVKTDRFTAEQERGVEAVLAAVGGRGFSRCYLLFTGGDALKNTSLHDFIYQDRQSPLPGVVARFSGRVHLFNNEDAGREQVRELLLKAGLLHCPPAECVGSEVRRILLIGPHGGGKSSAGNAVLGRRHFEVDCDFHGGGRGHMCGKAEGGRVFVVDSAGLSGEGLTREQLLRDVESAALLADPGPHVVAVVVKIGQLSAADSRVLALLTELLEGVASRHAAVLFTHGDALGDRRLQDVIRSSRRVSDLVSCCRGRHSVLDSTRSGERAQVERFLCLIDDIIRENDGRHWSWDQLRSGDSEDTSCSNNVVEHALAARTPPSLLSVCWRVLSLSALFVRRYFHWI